MSDFMTSTILGTTAGLTIDFTIKAVQEIHDGRDPKISANIAGLAATIFGIALTRAIREGADA